MKILEIEKISQSSQELLALISCQDELILTVKGSPVARVVPIAKPSGQRTAGLHQGMVSASDDFDAPLPDNFWVN